MVREREHLVWRTGAVLILMGLFALPALGAVDMFIKIEGIDGEAKDKAHDKWIDVLSFSQGVMRPTDTSGGSTRTRSVAKPVDVKFTKYIDKASPKLAEACCNGAVIPEVTLELIKTNTPGRVPYMVYKLRNVIVSSYHVSGSADGDSLPIDEISLNYEAIEWKYTELDDAGRPKGDVITFWDFVTNLFLK